MALASARFLAADYYKLPFKRQSRCATLAPWLTIGTDLDSGKALQIASSTVSTSRSRGVASYCQPSF